jgi:hypothetical protein
MRGSGSTSIAANGVSSDCSTATVRAEKPHAGASGVPFMNRITLCSEIASAIASRIGFDCSADVGSTVGWLTDIGSGSNWLADMNAPGCQRVGVFVGTFVFSASACIAPPISAAKTS